MATTEQTARDAAPMSAWLRNILIAYLLGLGIFVIYALLRLSSLEYPDVAVVVRAPPSGPSAGAPPAPGGQGIAGTAPARAPSITYIFPHFTTEAATVYELAIYGSGFVEKSQVRLNGATRAPATTPTTDLIRVVPQPGDLVGSGVLVVDVVNPDAVSNAFALKMDRPRQVLRLLTREWAITRELQLILMVLFAGVLGSLIHATKSLADYIGNRSAVTSWAVWYVVRPFIGGALALILYTVLRGGFLAGTPADVRVISPFGAMAVAALTGMFADKAAQKLAEVFDTLFTTADQRGGKLAAPIIDKLDPPTIRTGTSTPVQVKIVGDRLGATRAVKIDGRDRPPDKVGDKEVVVTFQPEELKKNGELAVAIVTPDATSPTLKLFVSDIAIATKSLPDGKVGADYTATKLDATGGTPPYKWVVAGVPGLKVEAEQVKGKPTAAGNATLVVTATDAVGASAKSELTAHITD